MSDLASAFLLTFIAAMATAIGGFGVFLPRKNKDFFLTATLAFAGGVMTLISFWEIIPQSYQLQKQGNSPALPVLLLSLGVGYLIYYYIFEKLHSKQTRLEKISLLIPLIIIIHNIPEGLLTLFASLDNPVFGIKITLAVMLHNIPEGLAVSLPIFYQTGSKTKALLWGLIAGLMEFIGAAVGYFILHPYLNETIYGIIFAIIAGVMITTSLLELLPLSFKLAPRLASVSAATGALVMAISLFFL